MNEPRQYAGNQSPFQEYYDRVYGDKRGILFGGGNLQPIVLDLNSAQPLKDFELQGDFIWMDPDSSGAIRVKFSMAQPRAMTMRANYRFSRVPFKQLLLEWDAQPGETAILWTGWGVEALPSANDITNLSNILNPVPLDPEYAKYFLFGDDETDDSEAFMARGSAGPVAAQFSAVQVKNPAGSGKRVYVDAFLYADIVGFQDLYWVSRYNVDLATDTGSFPSKQSVATNSSARLRTGTLGAIAGITIAQMGGSTFDHREKRFYAPIRLAEGEGLAIIRGTVNRAIDVAFEIRERAA